MSIVYVVIFYFHRHEKGYLVSLTEVEPAIRILTCILKNHERNSRNSITE